MKKDIHPTSNIAATATCNSCNNTFTVCSTLDAFEVEVCSQCHPFYTGDQRIMDTAGRADKFRKRMEKAAAIQSEKPAKKEAKKEEAPEAVEEAVEIPEAAGSEEEVVETPEVAAESTEEATEETPAEESKEEAEA